MKYKLTVRDKTIEVPHLEFGINSEGMNEGWADLYIYAEDEEQEIYMDAGKKEVWTEWLNACCGRKNNPKDVVRRVVAEVYGGDDDSQLWRTITIEHGYISFFKEESSIDSGASAARCKYQVEIRRAPQKTGQVTVA